MEHFIADFGRNVVEVPNISENNAVKFKLNMNGITNFSDSVPSITANGTNFSDQIFTNGMNVTKINGYIIQALDQKSFLFDTTDTSINNGFVTYMNSQQNGIFLFVSGKGLKSSPAIDAWFAANGSVAWLGRDIINNYDTAYVGIWNIVDRKIMKEMTYIDDGSEKLSAEMETIYDTYRDMGACGYPQKLIDDGVTYSGGVGQYEFKRYPTDAAITPLSQFGIPSIREKTALLSVEMMVDDATLANGQNCRTSLRWFNGSTLLSSEFIENDVSKPNVWQLKWTEVTIPTDADGFTVVTSRYPSKATGGGVCNIRNVVMCLSSTIPKISKTEFGVNGIRTNNLVEGLEPNGVTVLIDANKNVINKLHVNKIREFMIYDNSYATLSFVSSATAGLNDQSSSINCPIPPHNFGDVVVIILRSDKDTNISGYEKIFSNTSLKIFTKIATIDQPTQTIQNALMNYGAATSIILRPDKPITMIENDSSFQSYISPAVANDSVPRIFTTPPTLSTKQKFELNIVTHSSSYTSIYPIWSNPTAQILATRDIPNLVPSSFNFAVFGKYTGSGVVSDGGNIEVTKLPPSTQTIDALSLCISAK